MDSLDSLDSSVYLTLHCFLSRFTLIVVFLYIYLLYSYTYLHLSVPLPLIQDADFLPDTYNPYPELQSPDTAVTVQTFNIHFWFVDPSHPECLWLPIGPFNEGKPVDGRALPTYQLEGLQ